jgi:hypothetical protein
MPVEGKRRWDLLLGASRWDQPDKLDKLKDFAVWLHELSAAGAAVQGGAGQGKGEGTDDLDMKPAEKPRTPAEEFVFAPSGGGYYIAGFGEDGWVPRRRGFTIIARLIRSPGEPVAMSELHGTDDTRIKADRHSKQPALDDQALREIRDELAGHRADRQRAIDENNTVAADIAEQEILKLNQRLAQALGKGGKARDLNNPLDRLRASIHGNLNRAYKLLRGASPPMTKLAEHFDQTIGSESGKFFAYRPATSMPWRFERTADRMESG